MPKFFTLRGLASEIFHEIVKLVSGYVATLTILVGCRTYDIDRNNLAGGLLHLTELTNEVPEARLGHRLVLGKDAHSVELWSGLLLRRQVPTDDLVLLHLVVAVMRSPRKVLRSAFVTSNVAS